MNENAVAVIGAGLAGCEAAWALARAGVPVALFEMRPGDRSPAHTSPDLAELVCSNSLRSDEITSGAGLLKREMRDLGGLVMAVAEQCRVPAGKALAVDRGLFGRRVTERIEAAPGITLIRKRIDDARALLTEFDRVIVAAGPLAHEGLSANLAALLGEGHLYFYDAIAPIIAAEGIDRSIVFQGSRYGDGEGDYLNCPMNEEEYRAFVAALLAAEKVRAHAFERERHFEGCMPIEALAERGDMTLAFGSFKPVGFRDPRTGQRPFAIVQLRAENAERTAFNLVGCQTKLTYAEQNRVFRLIPGLAGAEFLRFGSMHRNTFVNAPAVLAPDLSLRAEPRLHLAGQITGVEGYVESAANGLWAGLLLAEKARGRDLPPPPPTTAMGALLRHLATPAKNFQPSNCNFGLMPEPEQRPKKRDRKACFAERARADFAAWLGANLPERARQAGPEASPEPEAGA